MSLGLARATFAKAAIACFSASSPSLHKSCLLDTPAHHISSNVWSLPISCVRSPKVQSGKNDSVTRAVRIDEQIADCYPSEERVDLHTVRHSL